MNCCKSIIMTNENKQLTFSRTIVRKTGNLKKHYQENKEKMIKQIFEYQKVQKEVDPNF